MVAAKPFFSRMLRSLYYRLPPRLRLLARRLTYAPGDIWRLLTGRRSPLEPPRGLIYTGAGDFLGQGQHFLRLFIGYGGLQPHHHVLDVGSGIGRMAIPLTTFLDPEARYEGFDVVKTGVRWCRRHITPRFPNFVFRHVALKNDLYTESGGAAEAFAFPYSDDSFDFVILTSVFTHMLPPQVAHYLEETSRVLRPGGRMFATFFLFATPERNAGASPQFSFPYEFGHYRLMDRKVRSANVAYDEQWLREQAQEKGLKIESMHYGYWRGGEKGDALDFQDVVVMIV